MESFPESAGPTCVNNCPFARTGPLRTKSRCGVPMRFTPGWHSGDAGVCLWAVHGATELRVFQFWHSCCELRLRSTPRYRLVCICFPTPVRGLPYGSGLVLSRCLGPGECLHSFTDRQAAAAAVRAARMRLVASSSSSSSSVKLFI